jgi:Flp pilus assembly protein CpaB
VVGGLLVTLALVGTWWSAGSADVSPSGPVVVAARDLAAGRRLRAGDVRVVDVDLPASLRGRTFRSAADLRGAVTAGALGEGDLVQRGAVRRGTPAPDARELSFVVDAAWAAGGALEVGDRIDVLVTYGEGLSSQTQRVLAGVAVLGLDDAGGGFGAAPTQTVTVAISDPAHLAPATNAVRAGQVTVVRATGARVAADADRPFRPRVATEPTRTDERSGR